ncbi:cytochrome P450 [Micromonospora sp. WMMD1102]|uniref:cytochrome P450 n=1 Tax=Micromonospora sp. WMMD1102 TaxID=3016105 RepID=UPI0024157A82|nr:cytochrome P450 [Micromonospora sp. WMMD1102]MDG4787721.1 cytochrome P450 [Micromonospora sp. WMMD1102]
MTTQLSKAIAVPGPAGHPLLGMLPALRHDLLGSILDGFHTYGDVVAYHVGLPRGPRAVSVDVVNVHHPDGIHQVLTTPQVFSRRASAYEILREFIGEGLLTSDGDRWLRQRRTLQPLFTPRRVARYTELMADEAARVVDDMAVTTGSVVDLYQVMQRYTMRVVGRALFGDDIDEVVPRLQELMPILGDLALARALQVVKLPLSWPTPRSRRIMQVRATQYEIIDGIIAVRQRSGGEENEDMLSRLFAAEDPETGQALSMEEIRDQMLVFLLAGHETTSAGLAFTMHLLGRHPEVQERVVAGIGTGDDELVRAAAMEGMRLYPPVYSMERMTETDVVVSGHRIPANTKVVVAPWVTHRHPEFWPDPERFEPDRFLGQQERPRYAYFPFGGGPRSCIGEHFALLEMTVLLSALLARYRVDTSDERLEVVPMVTLRPADAVRVTLTVR